MEKEKGLASGEAFLRLETSALPPSPPSEPQAGISAACDVHSAASASNQAESVANSAEAASHSAVSVTNAAGSQMIHGKPVSLLSIATISLTPMKSITQWKGGGGRGVPHHSKVPSHPLYIALFATNRRHRIDPRRPQCREQGSRAGNQRQRCHRSGEHPRIPRCRPIEETRQRL